MTDVTTQTWRDKDTHVVARQPPEGFLCSLHMAARVPLSPEALYALLTSPESARIFSQLKVRRAPELGGAGAGGWRPLSCPSLAAAPHRSPPADVAPAR